MINLLVVSDSHGRYEKLEEVLERQLKLPDKFKPTHLLHLGDGVNDVEKCRLSARMCVCLVRGNCDGFFQSIPLQYERELELGGVKILMMHGHTKGVKGGDFNAVSCAASIGADLLLYGHTHTPVSYTLEKGTDLGGMVLQKRLVVLNPGSLGYNGSFGAVSIDGDSVTCSHGSLN